MKALAELVAAAGRGEVALAAEQDVVNMHCHTFFSFNAYGHSPASLAWLAKKRGFTAIGIVDFDVLDAVDEFLAACDLAGVRGSAGIETRVFIPEFASARRSTRRVSPACITTWGSGSRPAACRRRLPQRWRPCAPAPGGATARWPRG